MPFPLRISPPLFGDAFPLCVTENSLDSVNFSRHFTTTRVKNIVLYTKDFITWGFFGVADLEERSRGPGTENEARRARRPDLPLTR